MAVELALGLGLVVEAAEQELAPEMDQVVGLAWVLVLGLVGAREWDLGWGEDQEKVLGLGREVVALELAPLGLGKAVAQVRDQDQDQDLEDPGAVEDLEAHPLAPDREVKVLVLVELGRLLQEMEMDHRLRLRHEGGVSARHQGPGRARQALAKGPHQVPLDLFAE